MQSFLSGWQFWAVLSACFAALTAIFGKIGVENINSHYATLIRTVVILVAVATIVVVSNAYQSAASIPRKTWIFLILSGVATAASWLCYFRALSLGPVSRVAPFDKLSVVLVAVLGVLILGERLLTWNWVGVVLIVAGTILIGFR
ncbi:MAG: EamA family transporter [Rhodospirillaceae bacterium]|nr:EamA family transporter [Rhodospirillaceae bacterium]